MTNESKSMSVRLGHVKRRLKRGEALTGKHLELALEVVGNGNTGHSQTDRIAHQLEAGQGLDAYEMHLMLDVFLLHARLSAGSNS